MFETLIVLEEAMEPWYPFGKPGPGAGPKKPQENLNESNSSKTSSLPPQPNSAPAKNKKRPGTQQQQQLQLDEYNRIAQQLSEIQAAEEMLKREVLLNEKKKDTNYGNSNDQSKVPAAMRTNIMFGDVKFEDDIKKAKELERKKWLQELEMQKMEKLMESQRKLNEKKLSDDDNKPFSNHSNPNIYVIIIKNSLLFYLKRFINYLFFLKSL